MNITEENTTEGTGKEVTAKAELKRKLKFVGSGVAVVAVAFFIMWLFVTPATEYDELEVRAPESYDAIFEVFMQARTRLLEESELDAQFYDDDFYDDHYELDDFDDLDGLDIDGFDTGVFDIDDFYDDPEVLSDYEALYEDVELWDDDYYANDEGFDDEDYFDDDFYFDEDDFDEDYFANDYFFDEDDFFLDNHKVSMEFSDLSLAGLESANAQNPQRALHFEDVSGNHYLYITTAASISIVSVSEDGKLRLAGSIAETDTTIDKSYVNLFLVDNRLIALRTTPINLVFADDDLSASPHTLEDEADHDPNSLPATAGDTQPAAELAEDLGEIVPDDMPDLIADPSYTSVQIFDLSAAASPTLISEYNITGNYLGSRMKGAQLYLATYYGVFNFETMSLEQPETFIPYVESSDGLSLVLADDIRIAADMERRETVYTQLVGIDVSGDTELLSQVAFLGGSDLLYAGANNIYLANNTETSQDRTYKMTSFLTRIEAQEGVLSFAESITLPGTLDSPAHVNEHSSGMLYLVAASFSYTEPSGDEDLIYEGEMQVFVLDNMEIVGTLDGFGENQDIFPKHFAGELLYLTTFDSSDKGYLVDLSDPAHPRLVSDFDASLLAEVLLPWQTEGEPSKYWLGLGSHVSVSSDSNNDEEDEAEGGEEDAGLALVLYSAEDSNTGVVHSIAVEDYYFSTAFLDRDAFFTEERTGLIAFPADESYLIYSLDSEATAGFSRLKEVKLTESFGLDTFVRTVIIGEQLIAVQFAAELSLWSFELSDHNNSGLVADVSETEQFIIGGTD